jgi:hypothetical protein
MHGAMLLGRGTRYIRSHVTLDQGTGVLYPWPSNLFGLVDCTACYLEAADIIMY